VAVARATIRDALFTGIVGDVFQYDSSGTERAGGQAGGQAPHVSHDGHHGRRPAGNEGKRPGAWAEPRLSPDGRWIAPCVAGLPGRRLMWCKIRGTRLPFTPHREFAWPGVAKTGARDGD
jgi:hypothetical protein